MLERLPRPALRGFCDERFEAVRAELERNFAERGELGASVCVMHEGRVVVDLWGGRASADGEEPWTEDTMVVVYSCTKGATALCAHLLADAGDLDLDAAVARYWPSFAREGKSEITVRMLLNHQAGLPGVSRPLSMTDVLDFERMVNVMETERPLWRPGSRHGYHALTFGWLVGEVVRRVSGQTVGQFFQQHVAQPLALDFWIGLPDLEELRVAQTVIPQDEVATARFDEALTRRAAVQVAVVNSGGGSWSPDAPGAHGAQLPASGGIANARALAGMYSALACDDLDGGGRLLSADQLTAMAATESAGEDAVSLEPSRFSAGYEKTGLGQANLAHGTGFTLSEPAFGHTGLGGSAGFADPRERLSFGYAMNRHAGRGESETARCQPLIDAAYRSLGYRSCATGRWVR
jgi:CubicO group peptidase (beta-lactamase class C family)